MFGKLVNPDKAELGGCRGTEERNNRFYTGTERDPPYLKEDKISLDEETNEIGSMAKYICRWRRMLCRTAFFSPDSSFIHCL